MSAAPIRVALADDQALVRSGLIALLAGFPELEIVVQADDGQALLDLPREWHLRLTDALLQSLVTWLGDDALEISYRAYVAPVVEGRRQRNAHFVAADDEE